ncbi:MAG: alpha/beta hydrolase [Renibacterium sp.]|nr:alpha/beta hydrolase [Renibacterium sp.]
MALDPIVKQQLAAAGKPKLSLRQPGMAEIRAAAARADSEFWDRAGVPAPRASIERLSIPVAHPAAPDAPDVVVRIYRPPSASGPLPGLVTFFGGAFRQGSNDYASNVWMHASRAVGAGIAVVAVDYALAPEHSYPTQIVQGLAVLDWLQARGVEHGVDPASLALGGQSSGGNIAAAVAQRNLDESGYPMKLQLLEVPVLDLTGKHTALGALRELGIPSIAMRIELGKLVRNYLGDRRLARDPRASPLLRDDLSGLPPTVILAAEYDVLRGDAAAYHARLRAAGIESAALLALGQTHDSNGMIGIMPAAKLWQETVLTALRRLHS